MKTSRKEYVRKKVHYPKKSIEKGMDIKGVFFNDKQMDIMLNIVFGSFLIGFTIGALLVWIF